MAFWKVKFFGSKNRKEQIKQVKTVIEASSRENVESNIRRKLGYEVINGLKTQEYEEK